MRRAKPDLLFVLSVDTEEEWDWSAPLATRKASLLNGKYLQDFQIFCSQQEIRPSYFFDYVAASHGAVVAAIAPFLERGECEAGTRLNPWLTPPTFEEPNEFNSHLVNLPADQLSAKLDTLFERHQEAFGTRPLAFRAGRWGANEVVLKQLQERGIRIDSSMYPGYRNQWFDCDGTPLAPYWPDESQPTRAGRQRNLMELPVTAGFNWRNQKAARSIHRFLNARLLAPLHLVGIAWHLKLLRKLYLSPEVCSGSEMKALVDTAVSNDLPMLHMFLHSSSLLDNSAGMLNQMAAYKTVTDNIASVVDYARTVANLKFCTISEAACLANNRAVLHVDDRD